MCMSISLCVCLTVSVCVSVCVGVILPYDDGTFAAELVLVFIVGVSATIQIRIGLLLTYLLTYYCQPHCLSVRHTYRMLKSVKANKRFMQLTAFH